MTFVNVSEARYHVQKACRCNALYDNTTILLAAGLLHMSSAYCACHRPTAHVIGHVGQVVDFWVVYKQLSPSTCRICSVTLNWRFLGLGLRIEFILSFNYS